MVEQSMYMKDYRYRLPRFGDCAVTIHWLGSTEMRGSAIDQEL
jgi:hypothetical protein